MSFDRWLRANISIPVYLYKQGMNYSRQLEFIRRFHTKSLEEIRRYQLERIKIVVAHAYNTVPYYREEWRKIGLEPGDVKSFEDFRKIPILPKNMIRENLENFLSTRSKGKELIKSGTGGTTDSPIPIYYDYERARIKEAEMHYFRHWFGWNLGDKVAYLWGAPQDIPNLGNLKYKIVNRMTLNKLYLFASLMNKSIMNNFIEGLNNFKPDVLQGYSNPTYILAEYIIRNALKVHTPKSVVLTAEPCSPFQRRKIEDAFNTEVFTFYGCREGGYVGIECRMHTGYHINCSSIYMEFQNCGNGTTSDKLGFVVFTDLYNFDMPFIRYRIGDMGVLQEGSCDCGSSLPLMSFFAGRETDIFITPSGILVPGVSLCDRIIEDCQGIEQLQFIQDRPDELVVKIVKGRDYSIKVLDELDRGLNRYFRGELKIRKIFVNDIPREKSGKTRFCISNVTKNL